MTQRYKIKVEYIGSDFYGSQKQPDKPTIQEALENAICTLTKNNTKKIVLSGRTDAKVHARGQVAHFDTSFDFNDDFKFINAVNGILPQSISVTEINKVESDFHAQLSAKARWYRYRITNRIYRSPFDYHSLLVRNKLSVERMNQSLSYLIGVHDFTSFKSVNTDNPAKVCNMLIAKCQRFPNDLIYFDFLADRFLYKMIRTIIGTVLMIEKKSFDPSKMKEILDSKSRVNAGPTISPDGLTLMTVYYNKENIMEAYNNENLFS